MTTHDGAAPRRRLARTLGELREARGYSRRDLAERSGLSYPYVSQIENGDREPSFKALAALAGGLGVEIGELTGGGPSRADLPLLAMALTTGPSFANPEYVEDEPRTPGGDKPRRRSARPKDLDGAVEQAYRALSLLPPAERLEAAVRLLHRVVPGVVEEEVERRARSWRS